MSTTQYMFRKLWWEKKGIILESAFHSLTVAIFVLMMMVLDSWVPILPSSEFEGSLQLLGQVLALIVGVLLIGTTINLSSYSGAEPIIARLGDLKALSEPLLKKYIERSRPYPKLSLPSFRYSMMARTGIPVLRFKIYGGENDGWYIYRPNWDGVWYQIIASPFYDEGVADEKLAQVQALHEAVICARRVLHSVAAFRSSGSALLGRDRGSNGARWFVEKFDKAKLSKSYDLPSELSLDGAAKLVSLAVESVYYMNCELAEHSENSEWSPFVLTTFQVKYSEYLRWVFHFIEKLQFLRMANVIERYPEAASSRIDLIRGELGFDEIYKAKRDLWGILGKVVSSHGTAKYFHSIKLWSIPGIGVSFVVLLGMLCGWPFLKWSAEPWLRNLGFRVLYAAGIASLVESSIFVARLLWSKRTVG